MRSFRPLTTALALALCFGGCGGDEKKKQEASAPEPAATRAPAARVITNAEARTVKIGLTKAQVLSQFGQPLLKTPGRGKRNLPCFIYKATPDIAGNWQFCFQQGKLQVVASGGRQVDPE